MLKTALTALWIFLPTVAAAQTVGFNKDVRPILADKCFICHGPDAATKKVPFRLDREEFAKADLGGGRHAVVDGNPSASGLLARITSPNAALKMPPKYTQQTLTDNEISILRRWIEQGAKWQPHWSLIPPKTTTALNTIDGFIQLGVQGFILSSTPALEEAFHVGEEVLPLVRGSTSFKIATR